MIIDFFNLELKPKLQSGEVVNFDRRKPEDGNLCNAKSLTEIFDYIRMLDAEGYPPAFFLIGDYKLEFSAKLNAGSIKANVIVSKGS